MNIINFIEKLAHQAHHKSIPNVDLDTSTLEIYEAFSQKDAIKFKKLLNDTNVLADRTLVTQI